VNLVIDADVVNGYYRESVRGDAPMLTAATIPLFDGLGQTDVAIVDLGGQIENEWGASVDPDWFRAWYANLLADGAIRVLDVGTFAPVIERLQKDCGYPKSRDRWYVRTACQAVETDSATAVIVSEDLDFYEPSMKAAGAKRRDQILANQRGCVADYLRKYEDIVVQTVKCYTMS
jgi:hypothetical protein